MTHSLDPVFQRGRNSIQIRLLQQPEGFVWLAYELCHLSIFIRGLPYRSLRQMTWTCSERMSCSALSISGALVWQLDLTGLWKMEMWHHTNLHWTHQSFSQDGNVTSMSFFICPKFTRTLKSSRLQWTQIKIQSMLILNNTLFHSAFLSLRTIYLYCILVD